MRALHLICYVDLNTSIYPVTYFVLVVQYSNLNPPLFIYDAFALPCIGLGSNERPLHALARQGDLLRQTIDCGCQREAKVAQFPPRD